MAVNAGPNSASRHSASPRSARPIPLVKLPTLTIMYHVVGHRYPMVCAGPSSEETGTIMPENCIVGITDSTAAAKAAVTCVPAIIEISSPQPVAASA